MLLELLRAFVRHLLKQGYTREAIGRAVQEELFHA